MCVPLHDTFVFLTGSNRAIGARVHTGCVLVTMSPPRGLRVRQSHFGDRVPRTERQRERLASALNKNIITFTSGVLGEVQQRTSPHLTELSVASVGGRGSSALLDQPLRRATTRRPDFAPVDRCLQSNRTFCHIVRGGVPSADSAPQAPPRAQVLGCLLIGWLEQYRTGRRPAIGNGDPGVATA